MTKKILAQNEENPFPEINKWVFRKFHANGFSAYLGEFA